MAARRFIRCKVCRYLYPAKTSRDPSSGYAWHARHDAGHQQGTRTAAARRNVAARRRRRLRRR